MIFKLKDLLENKNGQKEFLFENSYFKGYIDFLEPLPNKTYAIFE